MIIKEAIRKLIFRERASSSSYINFLRNQGVEIGEDCEIFVPQKTVIDIQNPWMLKIGNHVRITDGVKILTHDYSWSVLKRYKTNNIDEGKILGAIGPVEIGNNVFIGMNAIITRNVKIGDNVIIGAGSVVTHDCTPNSVYAGNPAKRIIGIDEFYDKREKLQLEEAKEIAICYRKQFESNPPQSIFAEYCMLFSNWSDIKDKKNFMDKANLCANIEATKEYLENHKPMFTTYKEFLDYCYSKL